MKKKFLFVCAASALLAACSTDEIVNENQGTNETPVEETATTNAVSVTTPEGIGMSVGVFGDDATTRAGENGQVTFDVLPDLDIMESHFTEYEIKADDFYIRKNGKYLDVTPMEYGGSKYPGKENILVTVPLKDETTPADPLTVRVQGLEQLAYNSAYNDDYTFEVYLWVERTSPKLNEGSGTVADLFDLNQKLDWISGWDDGTGADHRLQSGIDITTTSEAELYKKENGTDKQSNPDGYLLRYNVYRGLSGYQEGLFDENGNYIGDDLFDANGNYTGDGSELGNTPYVKVSIHVNKLKDDMKSSITKVYSTND